MAFYINTVKDTFIIIRVSKVLKIEILLMVLNTKLFKVFKKKKDDLKIFLNIWSAKICHRYF